MEKLTVDYKLVWDMLSESERKDVMTMGEDYKAFLDSGKTERTSIDTIIERAKAEGYVDLHSLSELKAGQKVYSINRGGSAMLAVVGSEPMTSGVSVVGSHVDSPRIDLKQNPLYEDGGFALFKTHYYGGIRKYQWVALPLTLCGVVVLKDGSKISINIGDAPNDPAFYITDLLPHLAADQNKKTLGEGIVGEALNVIVGSTPCDDKDAGKRVKQNILQLLNEKYGMCEEDFISADLQLVPSGPARDIGFDRSLVAAYGHDDRVCAYTSMKALFEVESCKKTAIALFVDKEEVGSMGNTGMHSAYFVNTLTEMVALQKGDCSTVDINRMLSASAMLSGDVSVAFDPTYPSVTESRNVAYMGKGATIVKYTGSRGKSGTNDATAEFVGHIRKIFSDNGVVWQTGELGKVDQGGGGTIAYILANRNMDVLDVGVPVLSMHAPYEVVSKADVYMTVRAYREFFKHN